jgi:hypothetical protein
MLVEYRRAYSIADKAKAAPLRPWLAMQVATRWKRGLLDGIGKQCLPG